MKNILKGAIRSFYSREFYSDLAHRWKGIGFGFILLLAVIQTGFIVVEIQPFLHSTKERIPELADTLPVVVYKNGKISIDKPVPYSVPFSVDPPVNAVIDTDYKITDVDALAQKMKQDHIAIFVTADKFILLKADNKELDIRDLSSVKQDFVIGHDNWHAFGEGILLWFLPVLIITLFMGAIIVNFILVLIRGVVLKILALIISAPIDFLGALRLASAITIPIAIINGLLPFVGVHALLNIAQWIVLIGYMVFAITATKMRDSMPI